MMITAPASCRSVPAGGVLLRWCADLGSRCRAAGWLL